MDTTETTEGAVDTTTNEGDGAGNQAETISVSKSDYEKMNQTLGSLKREIKDLRKSGDSKTPDKTKPDEFGLVQKSYLRAAGITDAEEVELALATSKKWGMELDKVVDDEDFTVKLEKLRTTKANALATSNVRGGAGTSQAKSAPEYWIAKGTPPSRSDVPDRKARVKIARAMIANTRSSKTFYND